MSAVSARQRGGVGGAGRAARRQSAAALPRPPCAAHRPDARPPHAPKNSLLAVINRRATCGAFLHRRCVVFSEPILNELLCHNNALGLLLKNVSDLHRTFIAHRVAVS